MFSLTETERAGGATRRWEGRRLRQQRLQVLCRRRQWDTTRIERGQADVVGRIIEPWAVQAVLEVAADGDETTASYAAAWLRTGALRLSREGGLDSLPAVVLSELLLEADGIIRGSEAAEG